MKESQSNNLINRDKNNALSIYSESEKCDFSHLVPSSLPVCQKVLSNHNLTTLSPAAQNQSVFSTPGYTRHSYELANLFSQCNKQ